MRPLILKLAALVALSSYGYSCEAVFAARFVDLGGNWAERYVNMLSDAGVITPEPDGKFRPETPVTRAVFAYWLVKTLGLDKQPVSGKQSYPDVKPSDWCYKPIEIIRQNNYISGYADGFRPNQFIQREEVIAIIARTLNTTPPAGAAVDQTLSVFSDATKIRPQFKGAIAQATVAGVVITSQEHMLKPIDLATRSDTAALLYKLNEYVRRQTIAENTQQALSGPPATAVNLASSGGYGTAPPVVAQGYGQPGYPPYGQPQYSPPGYGAPQYRGQVMEQTQYAPAAAPPQYAPPPTGYAPPAGYLPPQGYPPQTSAAVPPGYPPMQAGAAGGYQPPVLQGAVSTVAAGTKFQASLKNTLDSGSTQLGEPVEATLASPIYSGGVQVVPAGSKLIGSVTEVDAAKRFRFGNNGKMGIKFTTIETPDGRKFSVAASVDDTYRMEGGTTGGRVGKSLLATGVGAGGGAALGTALGAIVGGTAGGPVGRSTGMGAVFGTALGGGVGVIGAGVRKGSEVKITAGTSLPVKLDENLQVTALPAQAAQQPYPVAYPPPSYAPPVYQGQYAPAVPQGYPPQQPANYPPQQAAGYYPAQ